MIILALLISASLKMNLACGTAYNSQIAEASSASKVRIFDLEENKTFVIDEWRREITIDAWGGISGGDYYLIFNNRSEEFYRMTFNLPANASNISVRDAYEDYSNVAIVTSVQKDHIQVTITLRRTLKPGERNEFLITYGLPSSRYISRKSWQDYTLELDLVKPENWFVKKFSLIISLPEGAEMRSFSNAHYKVEKQGLSTKVIMTENDLVEFHYPHVTLEYQYIILWGVLKPMIWTAVIALAGAAFFFIRRLLHPAAVVTPVSISTLRKFVEVYEEKRRLSSELESLQRKFRSGKLSRRRLRLRRRSLEQRLSALNRRLAELKDQIITMSDQYKDMLRELETAEAEIETLNADIERVEARFRRGEISADARRRLLDEYNRIKERAESTISEILLRLEEGI